MTISQVNPTPSKLCYLAPYCCILKDYRINVTEEYLLGITKGVTFEYYYLHNFRKTKQPKTQEDTVSVVGSKSKIHEHIHTLLGVEFQEIFTQDPVEAFLLSKEYVENKKTMIAFFDAYFLDYHPQYKNTHGQTNLVLYDWDDREEQLLFLDYHVTTIPTSACVGRLSQKQFADSIILGDNQFNGNKVGLITSRFSHEPIKFCLEQLVREQAMDMLYPAEKQVGISGMLDLANAMAWWPSFWPEKQIKNVLRQIYHHISGRGGAAACRSVYSDFLSTFFRDRLDIDMLSKGFERSSKMWSALGVKCFRGSLSYTPDCLVDIANCLRNIAELEQKVFSQLLGGINFENDF